MAHPGTHEPSSEIAEGSDGETDRVQVQELVLRIVLGSAPIALERDRELRLTLSMQPVMKAMMPKMM